jgi:hypothetical protein
MNDCERLSDRMPDVAAHRAGWTTDEAAHLAGCPECLAEWRLVLAARALDQRAPAVSNLSALPAALRVRLAVDRAPRARARRAWSAAGVAAAAAAIVVMAMTGSEAGPVGAPPPVVQAEALVPLPELEGLGTAQLDTLLQTIDRPFADKSTLDASTLGEYEDEELEQVFATWEG